ncbi:MAG: isoprenylcysteine carboxylmethyltransferase family protein [Dehalococcoidia bacterium]|jgi:protein-S-isoprenylcysteine O-methyltransferase Ste14
MNELFFRVSFSILWIIFIFNLIWVRYSLREPGNKSSIDNKATHESRLHIVGLAFFAPFWFGGIILYAIIPGWIMFLSISLPDWFRLIMVGVAALSIPFTLWGYRTLGKNWVHALEQSEFLQRKSVTLVTSGPYRYVRHPIYLGSFTFIITLALVAANWLVLLPALFIIALIDTQIGKEERMLIDRFGDEYREYMKRTPQLIPKLNHNYKNDSRGLQ